jgi:hypothetical protein
MSSSMFSPPQPIMDETQLHNAIADLTKAIQNTIRAKVPLNAPCPHSKRWWNSELKDMKKEVSKLSNISYKYRAIPDHVSHDEYRTARNKYAEEITKAKEQHWADYLEEVADHDLWTATKYLSEPTGDGGCSRIPTLKVVGENGQVKEINTNEEKAKALSSSFFPEKPNTNSVPPNFNYPDPIQLQPNFTRERICTRLAKLAPYKASGPDEIPNIVLQRTVNIIIDHLYFIFQAIFSLNVYHVHWQEFTTAVLRKPGKPSYEVPKAYRPIALIPNMAKLLTGLVAEDILYVAEKFELLPTTHFGGRPGRMTTDAIHILIDKIKDAWRRRKVISILFLDIEGAFPNAVNARLIHNMRK